MKPDLYVVARIIKILKENSRMKKTNLATASGLAYDKLAKYLEWMIKKGFIEVDSEGFVCLTSKGNKAYEELVKWILEHIGRLEFPRF